MLMLLNNRKYYLFIAGSTLKITYNFQIRHDK